MVTYTTVSVGTVPHSLTFGRARGGAYRSEHQPAPITWHMSAPPGKACSTVARFNRHPITARYNTVCFPHTQHLSLHTTARHTQKFAHTHKNNTQTQKFEIYQPNSPPTHVRTLKVYTWSMVSLPNRPLLYITETTTDPYTFLS